MLCVDVNVLVYAHRSDSAQHEQYFRWLDRARGGSQPLGLCDIAASGFLRVVTHPKVFREPSSLADGLEFVGALRRSPAVVVTNPGERHYEIFEQLCIDVGARGNLVPDAYLAAVAIEHGAVWVSADRGFARFRGLRWQHPLDDV